MNLEQHRQLKVELSKCLIGMIADGITNQLGKCPISMGRMTP